MPWCVLVCDDGQMAGDVVVLGPYRSQENASKAADAINRKIEIHSEAMDCVLNCYLKIKILCLNC